MTDRQPCIACGDWLDISELEIGSGYCHPCGHEQLAGELSRLRSLATRMAKDLGFASITAAAACYQTSGDKGRG